MNLINEIKKLANERFSEVVEIRRHLHRHPERSFAETMTSAYISEQLKKLGIEHKTGIAGSGILGIIKGNNPSKKVIALRADMDALPVEEKTNLEYSSENKGVMHACGHDIHMASLLGAAGILNSLKNNFEGTVKLIFQPAEEKIPGGALQMIKEGVLSNPEVENVYGQHVMPQIESGKVGFRPGIYMASSDELFMTIKGRGGHAAMPDEIIDPIVIASQIIVSLQQIASRFSSPSVPTVLSFGKIIGEGAINVIPDEVKLEGTFRTMNEEWRDKAHDRIKDIALSTAKCLGGKCEIEILKGYPCVVNDPETTHLAKKRAQQYLGEDKVIDLDIRMTAEDFAYFAIEKPSVFYRLGTGIKGEETKPLHSPYFNPDENSLQTGMGLMAWLAICELSDYQNL